jgi:hypothetical protein
MAPKKDKEKVLGEIFDDARVKSFLSYDPPAGVSADFHLLEKAYRGMNIDNFRTFLAFFKEAGRDLNAINPDGKTLVDIVAEHGHGKAYVQALKAA